MRILILLLSSLVVAAPAWTASRSDAPSGSGTGSKEERIGIGGGVAIGAIAGGPIGAIIGAALGGWTGDKFHRQRTAREDFEARFERASTDLESLERLLSGSERDAAELRAALSAQESTFRDAIREALEVEVFFHTGKAGLDERTHERLTRLGRVMQALDGITVVIEGHADGRGDADYNEQLSAERAASVRAALMEAGLPSSRITSSAAGEREATAAENDYDSLALERRVELNIVYPETVERVARQ
jgi:outer membrane protein OmpA-like peptidoglycan-associated protein